jgi:tripartite-type tricarboxylate transporter receptor subunit TctC
MLKHWPVVLTGILLGVNGAWAQAWPTKPIHAIVPFPPGGTSDVLARIACQQIAARLNQPIIIENRTGAGGTIGASMAAKAEPDGYTILIYAASHVVAAATYARLSYDPARDFAAVIPLAQLPNVLVVAPSTGIRTPGELVAKAKADPGAINFASGGIGTSSHLNAERFRYSAGFDAVHIPYKGAPEALADVMTGRVDFYFSPLSAALSLINEGRLMALAVSTPTRVAALPDVPTTVEAGFADSEYVFWTGIVVPSKTPREIVDKLYREARNALESPNVREQFAKLGAEPMPMLPAQFDAFMADDLRTARALVKAAGIKPQ